MAHKIHFTPATTVHEIAGVVRAEFYQSLNEAQFAELMMTLEQGVQGVPKPQAETILEILKSVENAQIFWLAIAWLDGKGYGELPFSDIVKLRGGILPPGVE